MQRSDDKIATSTKGKRKSFDPDGGGKGEAVSPMVLVVVFVVICLLGGWREYTKVTGSSPATAVELEPDQKQQLTIPLPHRELNPNFKSLLTLEEDQALEIHEKDHTRYHIVFSTDCSPYQHWQSYLVFFSAMKLRQPGHVTRIASGCEDDDAALMNDWFHEHIQGMSTRFHLHLTPRFSGVKDENGKIMGDYKFFNKPFGLKHWMEHAEHMSMSQIDDIVILIDPDMLLLRPLTGDFSDDREVVFGPKRLDHILGRKVEHGLPFAQTYGFGAQWQGLDLERIAGKDTPAKQYDQSEGRIYFPAGPPYMAMVPDMYQIAQKWSEFVPRVHEQYPHLLAEMFAFCIAAAHLELKHQIVDSLMVSATDANGEGWPLIDQVPNDEMCDYARHPDHVRYPLPSVVHACQRYSVGEEWFFGKRRFPTDFFECDTSLLMEPPDDLATAFDFKHPPNAPEPTNLTPKLANREAFMVCFLTSSVNEAATYYKQNACAAGGNLQKSVKMVELFKEYKKKHGM